LAAYLIKNRDIIVTTIHKFSYIQEVIEKNAVLKNRKIAFLIDEAHRSQDGKMALNMRSYFTSENEEVEVEEDLPTIEDEIVARIENLNISNQIFVAFTATTTPKTVSYFGEPFDSYTEEEAIREGYIFDVAHNILSYSTLYNLQLTGIIPNNEDYPAGLVSMALRSIAFNDDSLIQYKSNVILNLFNERVLNTCNGRGKAMVVVSSRPAGLKFYYYIKEIIKAKELSFKVLFAFSDYTDPITNESVEEVKLNQLDTLHNGKVIEDVFDLDEYRIIVVANKFQTGFDQPLLTAMFLDKHVQGVNAIQTVSRLNRTHPDKNQDDILVVDFTNNSQSIFDAFNRHRTGSPHIHREPNPNILTELYNEINSYNVFTIEQIDKYTALYIQAEKDARIRNSSADAILSNITQVYRTIFENKIPSSVQRREYVALLRRFVNQYYFMAQFFEIQIDIKNVVLFYTVMVNTLIKKGAISEFKKAISNVDTSRLGVHFNGTRTNLHSVHEIKHTGLSHRAGNEPPRTTIQAAIEQIQLEFNISDDDVLVIKEICEEVSEEDDIRSTVLANKDQNIFLLQYESTVTTRVSYCYINREMWDKLEDPIYIEKGGIIPIMSKSIISEIIHTQAS
jgi:type I restriction enzyme R subunit